MRKLVVVLAMATSLLGAMTVPVGAAALHGPHVGTMCETGFATLHFVNNQTGGAPGGFIHAVFDNGSTTVAASKVLKNVQHFDVIPPTDASILIGAHTNATSAGHEPALPGRLVLSDFTCEDPKKPPPKG